MNTVVFSPINTPPAAPYIKGGLRGIFMLKKPRHCLYSWKIAYERCSLNR